MRLLVSVRAADEVAAALAGGADIIDAKDPARGPLGPISLPMLGAISARVPEPVPLGVALGDFTAPDAVRRAVTTVNLAPRRAAVYVKLGFAGEPAAPAVTALIAAAVHAAGESRLRPVVVPVAYADWANAGSPTPEEVLAATLGAGAGAFLLDTYNKDGRTLLDWVALDRVRALVALARSAGMLVAIAGSLDLAALDLVADCADVVGVRGAACRGGRSGAVDAELVRRLRERLAPGPGHSPRQDEHLLAIGPPGGRDRKL